MSHRVIHLHPAAPGKPAEGAACNGCGVCCAADPCPVGMLVSGRRNGACDALAWDDGQRRYRCGMASDPSRVLRWLPAALAPLVRRLSLRWIAAARGCDSDLEPVRAG
jgi:hypothetical protein